MSRLTQCANRKALKDHPPTKSIPQAPGPPINTPFITGLHFCTKPFYGKTRHTPTHTHGARSPPFMASFISSVFIISSMGLALSQKLVEYLIYLGGLGGWGRKCKTGRDGYQKQKIDGNFWFTNWAEKRKSSVSWNFRLSQTFIMPLTFFLLILSYPVHVCQK